MPQDYFTILMKVISDASQDPAQLRKLVYALAWLKTEALLSHSLQGAAPKFQTLLKIERTLELHNAIERIEAIAVQENKPNDQAGAAWKAASGDSISLDDDALASHLSELEKSLSSPPTQPAFEGPSRDNALIIPPESIQLWPQQSHGAFLPPDLEDRLRVALNRLEQEPAQKPRPSRSGVSSFVQLIAAVIFGVAIYVGIAGWVHMGREATTTPAPVAALSAVGTKPATAATGSVPAVPQPDPDPPSPFSFPLPKTFGIYAGSQDKLVPLEQLPIKIPGMRVLVSAEINEPSHAIVPSGDLTFLVFRRDLVNSAPATASVRVVARVSRTMKFVDGKPTYDPLEGSWRVRAKSYEYTVAPLEGRREMIVMRPQSKQALPPGRYAVVINGYGYDFTVAGKVTAAEQCLEQVEVMNGTVVAECPKS